MFVYGKGAPPGLAPRDTRNVHSAYSVQSYMQLHVTDQAAAVIHRKGGTAVVDLLEPFG